MQKIKCWAPTGSSIKNVVFILFKNIWEVYCELKLVAKLHFIYDTLIFSGLKNSNDFLNCLVMCLKLIKKLKKKSQNSKMI